MDSYLKNKNLLFLIDGIGAVISALLLGVVLTRFVHLIGMPVNVLYFLALPACFFAVYSFTCYFLKLKNWRPYLKVIAIANLLYCCITLGLLVIYWGELTYLGITYFIVEIIIVVMLSVFELKQSRIVS